MLRKSDFLEELELSETDKKRIVTEVNRRVRRKRVMQVTIVAIILMVCGSLLYLTVEPSTADRESIRNRMEYDENTGIISGGFNENGNADYSILTYTETDIETFRKEYEQLLLPANIPEEFKFISLTVTVNKYWFCAEYKYDYNDSEFLITQTQHFINRDTQWILNVIEELDVSFGKVYVQRSEMAGYYGMLIYYGNNQELELTGEIRENNELSTEDLLFILEGMLDNF